MRDVERVVHQVLERDIGRRVAADVGDDREVDLAGGEHRQRLDRAALDEPQFDARVGLRERGDRERRERGAGGRERAEAQATGVELGERLELGLGGGEPAEDHLRVLDQQLARGRQADAARGAVDQPCARLGLERGDLTRDRGLRERQRVGGRGERSVRGDLAQDAQTADIDGHA